MPCCPGWLFPTAAHCGVSEGCSVELLTNRTTASERATLLSALAKGEVDLVVGTHALLTESVRFERLGMVVIDEQHRFGVEQRSALREKADGPLPDVLVMTATPIPRTAAMTVYGDLDTTVLDELPPGRMPVGTVWARGPLDVEAAWQTVLEEIGQGHQAYVVCPLVEESERVQAASASDELGPPGQWSSLRAAARPAPRPTAFEGKGSRHVASSARGSCRCSSPRPLSKSA